jgi:hypothetical protein
LATFANGLQQRVLQRGARCERVCDQQDPRLAEPERRHDPLLRKVRLLPIRLQETECDFGPVPPELDDIGALQRVQRPDDARRPEVERPRPPQRRLVVVLVERMRLPERLVRERALGLGHDRADRRVRPVRVPGRLRQRLVSLRVVQLSVVFRRRHLGPVVRTTYR